MTYEKPEDDPFHPDFVWATERHRRQLEAEAESRGRPPTAAELEFVGWALQSIVVAVVFVGFLVLLGQLWLLADAGVRLARVTPPFAALLPVGGDSPLRVLVSLATLLMLLPGGAVWAASALRIRLPRLARLLRIVAVLSSLVLVYLVAELATVPALRLVG